MTPEQQLQSILIALGIWATITTVLILVARRDMILGLKKWFYLRTRKQPLKIRYFGPDKNVLELLIPMKGKGETVTLFDKKLLIIKTKDGMTFFIDESALRRCDDGINELSYNYKSIMPVNPTMSKEDITEELNMFVRRSKADEESRSKGIEIQKAIEVDELVRFTDPKRLNKFIDYTYLAAKADALAEATDVAKWVKITAIGVGISIIGIIAVYYVIDGKVIPMIGQTLQLVQVLASKTTEVLL
jgi:hypothetical protein